jgi:hypothetical protein
MTGAGNCQKDEDFLSFTLRAASRGAEPVLAENAILADAEQAGSLATAHSRENQRDVDSPLAGLRPHAGEIIVEEPEPRHEPHRCPPSGKS